MAFQGLKKQSTATTLKLGPFVDKGDGVAYEVGMAAAMNHATTGVRISKNGGAFAARNTATEPVYDAFGYYLVNLDTTDTATLGSLKVIFGDAAVCLPCEADFLIVPANVYDSLVAGSDRLVADVEEIGANIITAAAIADGAIDKATLAADLKTGDYINAQVKGQDNIDFGALQKTSLNAASPASVAGAVGSVTGAVGSVTGAVGSVTGAVTVGTNNDKTGYSLGIAPPTSAQIKTAMEAAGSHLTLIKAVTDVESGVKAAVTALGSPAQTGEAETALASTARTEPASPPVANASLKDKVGWLFMLARNKLIQTAAAQVVRDNGDAADVGTASVSDDGTTLTRGKFS